MLRNVARAPFRRLGSVETMVIALLGFSLVSCLFVIRNVGIERDEWKDRLFLTLKSTSDAARASEKRLHQAMIALKESELDERPAIPVELKSEAITSPPQETGEPFSIQGKTTLILFCYNRPDYLKRTLESLTSRLSTAKPFLTSGMRVIISQDGYDGQVRTVSEHFVKDTFARSIDAEHIQHVRIDASDKHHMAPYYALSAHYSKGLDYAFRDGSERVIVLEDDLELAIDFFPYFQAFSRLLDEDESLFAISAWNDHGQQSHVKDSNVFYRTDVFPGLGWMLNKRLWTELKPKWPLAFWDDWLRNPVQRKGRQVVRPEVSRTTTFGQSGASKGQFFDTYLRTMKLNEVEVRLTVAQVENLRKIPFDQWFMDKVNQAVLSSSPEGIRPGDDDGIEQKIVYETINGYVDLAKRLKMMDDVKDELPRGSYRGIVPIRISGRQVYVVPQTVLPLA